MIETVTVDHQPHRIDIEAVCAHLTSAAQAGTLTAVVRHYRNLHVIEIPCQAGGDGLVDEDLDTLTIGRTYVCWDRRAQAYVPVRIAA